MDCPVPREPGELLRKIIEVYSKEKKVPITQEQKEMLVEYLLPYTQLSFHTPSELEIRTLSASLDSQVRQRIEEMLAGSSPEVRKAIYFLFKVQDKLTSRKVLPSVPLDTEKEAHKAAKSAAIGVYLSWFRYIAEGKGNVLKQRIELGLFDICYTVYTAGRAYLHLSKQQAREESEDAKVFYAVVRRHLEKYRDGVYREETGDLFEFAVKNQARMKWISRVCHLAQTFLVFENEEGSAGCITAFARSLEESPWTEQLAAELFAEYQEPLSGRAGRWLKGEAPQAMFIKELPGKRWSRFVLVEEDVPPGVGLAAAKQLLYLGKANRLLALIGAGEPAGGTPNIFDQAAVAAEHQQVQERVKRLFFAQFQVLEHLERLRDVFFLFREDFANDLFLSLSSIRHAEEAPAVVDEALERCFGSGLDRFIDVVERGPMLGLVYQPVFPYSAVTEGLAELLSEGFEFFWLLRRAIRAVHTFYQRAPKPAEAFAVVSLAKTVEYHYFERVVKEGWRFTMLADGVLYDPEKLSKTVEETAYHLISTCKDSCTLSVLESIVKSEAEPVSQAYLTDLLQRITCDG